MTNQEIFDIVAAHLIKQNHQATKGSNCAYRGEGGTMCAIGCLIKDEFYTEKLEGQTIYDDVVFVAVSKSLNIGIKDNLFLKELLSDLQVFHDHRLIPWSVEESLERFVKEKDFDFCYGVTFNPSK